MYLCQKFIQIIMEYIVSARKYRPITFDSVVGQAALNECESCQSFNEQRSLNIFELDAASNNSVEHIKTLMEQTRIPPQLGRYKVFIIDEVHMLSTAAFNAFLKTLEEPPAHVIFILATTEKHKILPTILSRCQIYDFERMTIRNTVDHLKHVAEKEGITYEEQALAVIAEKADGGMRDALSIFDQAASFCQGNITYEKVIEDLNVLDAENYFQIIDLSINNKVSDIMLLLNNVINKGFDGGLLIQGLAKHVRNVLMAKDPQTLPLLEVSNQQRQRYQDQAKKCETRFLYQALKKMNQCDINYRQSSNKRLLVELTLIEIAQITQPAEEGDSAGRSPRRLKSLFKHLMRQAQPKTAAPQVAAAQPVAPSKPSNPGNSSSSNIADNSSNPSQPNKAVKLDGIGFSWNNLMDQDQKKPSKINIIPGTVSPAITPQKNAQFSQEDLELQWMAMCNRMPQELSGIATRMKNMNPTITELPQIEVQVDNALIKKEMEDFKGRIVSTLRNGLQNENLSLEIRIAEQKKEIKIMTRREQFEKLTKENPAIEKLRQVFNLELA